MKPSEKYIVTKKKLLNVFKRIYEDSYKKGHEEGFKEGLRFNDILCEIGEQFKGKKK